ncbi:cytokine receptor common subunit beta [Centroberyx gerrardi]
MMPLLWAVFCSVFPLPALCSGPGGCSLRESGSQDVSPVLESLQCQNDYKTHVHCSWREGPQTHTHTPLQLWVWNRNDNSETLCQPFGPVPDADEHRTVQCRYDTGAFAIGISHTFFFKTKTLTPCSSVPHKPLELSQLLRVRPPVNLSAHAADGGGRLLRWSSPYPPSSPLSRNLTYQLSYRRDTQDSWTLACQHNHTAPSERCCVNSTVSADLRGPVLRYSCSLTVPDGAFAAPGQVPSLHCVLDGEKEVMCSWEVKRDLAHFITYQLACQHNHTAPSERCCVNSTVSADLRGPVLRYSCSLTVPDPAHLLLELKPTRNAKTFKAFQHIRPDCPLEVRVEKREGDWVVGWTQPATSSKLRLYYEVRYYNTHNQEHAVLQTVSGSTSHPILQASLAPSQLYQVQVRALVVPGKGPRYEGTPSEWSKPEEWTSHAASWSLSTLLYIFIGVIVAIVFLTLYCTVPACQRRAVLWVKSVPSPDKSKVLFDIKSVNSRSIMQSENTYICKVQHMESFSSCSSDAALWPDQDSEKKGLERCEDGGCWHGDNPPSAGETVNCTETSAMSFSGPYIFCKAPSEPCQESVDVQYEDKEEDTMSDSSAPPSPECPALSVSGSSEDYVCLPSLSLSRSTEDLASHCGGDRTTDHNREPNMSVWPEKPDIQPGLTGTSVDPPAYTTGPFTPWPQGGASQASGYCYLP